MTDRLLTLDEVATWTRLPVATLRYFRHCSTGPRSAKLGCRVVYRESDVTAWIDAQFAAEREPRRIPAADPGAAVDAKLAARDGRPSHGDSAA